MTDDLKQDGVTTTVRKTSPSGKVEKVNLNSIAEKYQDGLLHVLVGKVTEKDSPIWIEDALHVIRDLSVETRLEYIERDSKGVRYHAAILVGDLRKGLDGWRGYRIVEQRVGDKLVKGEEMRDKI